MKSIRLIFPTLLILLAFIAHVPAKGACDDLPTIQSVEIQTTDANGAINADVYLPPCYDPRLQMKYPVIYLFHGHEMDKSIWRQLGLAQALSDGWKANQLPQMVVVAVEEKNMLQEILQSSFGEQFLTDVMPALESQFHLCAEKQCRAISGISRGALWVEKIGFEHADQFISVGLHSLPRSVFDEQSLLVLTRQIKENDLPFHVLMDTGADDPYRVPGRDLSDQLNQYSFPFERIIFPGAHDQAYWRDHLPSYLRYHAQNWLKSPNVTPSP